VFKDGVITFDTSVKLDVLDIFGLVTDQGGYLMQKDSPGKYYTDERGHIHIDDFAGVMGKNGKLIVIRSDIGSLIELSDEFKKR
jgi:hypothetical protein